MSDNITTEQEQKPVPGLSLQDLLGVVQIINVVSQRGAFQATELSQVGTLYDKIVKFLEYNNALTKQQSETTTEQPEQVQN